MANILRSLIAGPRARHPDSNLDLCYVTPFLVATSGPSGTYPQRAYRNPLDQLVKYLDKAHGENWCIWEFRAEGTGYPDSEVYGRVRHYPWPDHHPPPFKVVPLAMASMRQWLGDEDRTPAGIAKMEKEGKTGSGRVVIVHCKAGKGRSGTMSCSYLISECGWKPEEALARFTERRMRPGFGQGVSIPSQLRWVGYVDRWTRGGKKFTETQVEILELHVWGLRDGVKVAIEGYVEEGKIIKTFHVFQRKERIIVEGAAPGGLGFTDMISDMAGYNGTNSVDSISNSAQVDGSVESKIDKARKRMVLSEKAKTTGNLSETSRDTTGVEAGGGAVMFKPSKPLIVPSNDICVDFERRNGAGANMTMVTAVAHVWFNTFFEGNGPERGGVSEDTSVFEIDWDKMDGIKGSLRKGTRALDRMAVVWKIYTPPGEEKATEVHEPRPNSPVPQMAPANWKGGNKPDTGMAKDLGLRTASPASADISRANSFRSAGEKKDDDDDSVEGVKPSGPAGEEKIDVNMDDLPQPKSDGPVHSVEDVNKGLDTASSTTGRREM